MVTGSHYEQMEFNRGVRVVLFWILVGQAMADIVLGIVTLKAFGVL